MSSKQEVSEILRPHEDVAWGDLKVGDVVLGKGRVDYVRVHNDLAATVGIVGIGQVRRPVDRKVKIQPRKEDLSKVVIDPDGTTRWAVPKGETDAPVEWEFNSGDRVELLDGHSRGRIVRRAEGKTNGDGNVFDYVYVVKLDNGPAVALLQSRIRKEQADEGDSVSGEEFMAEREPDETDPRTYVEDIDKVRQRVNCLLGSHRRYSGGDQEAIAKAVCDLLVVARAEASVDLGVVRHLVSLVVPELGAGQETMSPAVRALIAGLVEHSGDIDPSRIFADPQVWAEAQRFFPRHLFDAMAERENDDTWSIVAETCE